MALVAKLGAAYIDTDKGREYTYDHLIYIEDRRAAISLEGVSMEKINLPFFYRLGTALNPLARFYPSVKNRLDVWLACSSVRPYIYGLLETMGALTVCRAIGVELVNAVQEVGKWIGETPIAKWEEENPATDVLFRNVVDKAKEFETVLCAELQTLATYHAAQKGNYSTTGLIEQAENVLPASTRGKIGSNIVEEIRQSGRCLAFDNSTASGFHIIRAMEAVMHDYYVFVCKPASEEKLDSWAEYISALYKLTQDTKVKKSIREDVKRVIALLQLIKDQDRNLIMHPEVFLTPDDAHKLFEIAKGAIIAMTDTLPAPKKQ